MKKAKKMNKKQRNKKNVLQNKRNSTINKRYISTIKTLFKILKSQKTEAKIDEKENNTLINKTKILNNLYSIIDKAVKKNVIHKNAGARQKAKGFILLKNT